MKILLINPPTRENEKPSYFPLGLGYITSVLLSDGHHVEVLDINALRIPKLEVNEYIKHIEFDVVGLTGLITEYNYIKWLVDIIKNQKLHIPVMIGGGLASVAPQLLLEKTKADIIVVGEGEITTLETINALEDGRNLNEITGIWFKKDGIHQTVPRKPIDNLDSIPFPNRRLFPVEIYIEGMKETWNFNTPLRSTNLIFSRGCPYTCTYCDHSIWGHKFRTRSAENVIEEIKILVEHHDIKGVIFSDDTFILNKELVRRFCTLIKSEDIDISWTCNGRVNLIDKNILLEMKSAGCKTIGYGIESGSQTILNEMKKNVTVEQAKKAIQLTKEIGIRPIVFIMVGMFSENRTTVNETINFCRQLNLRAGINYVTPIPGTTLYQEAIDRGKIKKSLEEMLEGWGMWQNNLLVNLTGLSDEELKKLKNQADKQINCLTLEEIYNFCKKFGVKKLVTKGFGLLSKSVRIPLSSRL